MSRIEWFTHRKGGGKSVGPDALEQVHIVLVAEGLAQAPMLEDSRVVRGEGWLSGKLGRKAIAICRQ